MRVDFRQSGGYAGLVRGCQLDTLSLPLSEASELERLVRECGLGDSTSRLSQTARDLFEYEISVVDAGMTRRFVFDQQTIPQSAKSLVGYLLKHATPVATP